MTWGTLSLTGLVGRRQALGAQEDRWKTNLGRYYSLGFLRCQECRNDERDNINWYPCLSYDA